MFLYTSLLRFEEWFVGVLLPKLHSNSLIVMDNASYHSCRSEPIPVQSWTKVKLMEWLEEHGINNIHYYIKYMCMYITI